MTKGGEGLKVVEPTPVMPADDVTPILLRPVEHSSTLNMSKSTTP